MIPRIMHDIEKQYLTLGAQGLVYTAMLEERISSDVAERAINEAVNLGQLNNLEIDKELMRLLIDLAESEINENYDQVFLDHCYGTPGLVC